MVSEINDALQSGYDESPLRYDNVDWFIDEITKIRIKNDFLFQKHSERYFKG